MFRSLKLMGVVLAALAFGQSVSHAQAATVSTSFAVSVRVAAPCEAAGLCGVAAIHVLDASGHSAATTVPSTSAVMVTPLSPGAEGAMGQRIDTPKGVSNGPVEVDF
jgi:hypothetical protein